MARFLSIQGRSTPQYLTGEFVAPPASAPSPRPSSGATTTGAARGDLLRESGAPIVWSSDEWSPLIDLRREMVELSASAGGKHHRLPACLVEAWVVW